MHNNTQKHGGENLLQNFLHLHLHPCIYIWPLHSKIGHLDNVCLEIFEVEASPGEGQSLQQKDIKKSTTRKGGTKI